MIKSKRKVQVFSATMVICKRDVLLLQRHADAKFLPGRWGLPCGKVAFGEDPTDAAIRELFEETGIASQSKPQLFATSCFSGSSTTELHHNIQLNYLLSYNERPDVHLSDEHQDFSWEELGGRAESRADPFNSAILREGQQFIQEHQWRRL